MTKIRQLLQAERNPPYQQVIDADVIPRVVSFLENDDRPELQFEAAWALTNIASGTSEHTRVVIEAGAVPIFCKLLLSPSDDVREQAVWALGNIAGDSPTCRDLVLHQGALGPLLEQLAQNSKLSMLRNATWTLSNFCRGKPQPPFELVKPALPALASLIYSQDDEVLTDACWALSYLTDNDDNGSNSKIEAVIEAGATTINLPDTVGYTLPAEYGSLFAYLIEKTPTGGKVGAARPRAQRSPACSRASPRRTTPGAWAAARCPRTRPSTRSRCRAPSSTWRACCCSTCSARSSRPARTPTSARRAGSPASR